MIEAKTGRQLDVKSGSYEEDTSVIATPNAGDPASFGHNKVFVLEEASRHITSSLAYTASGRNVSRTVSAREQETIYAYNNQDRLLMGVTDARGNSLSYTYDTDTDRLLSVRGLQGGSTRAVHYSPLSSPWEAAR